MAEQDMKSNFIKDIERMMTEREFMESRLISGEGFVRGVSVYYACFAAVTAVLSLVYTEMNFHALSVVMTVVLALLVMLMSAQKGVVRAQKLRSECAALLRMKCAAEKADAENGADVFRQYLDMTASGDGLNAHEKRTVLRMRDLNEKRRAAQEGRSAGVPLLRGYEKFLYWFAEIAAIVLKVFVLLAPAACVTLVAVGLL